MRAWNAGAADELSGGRSLLTDSRGLPADPGVSVWGGAIFRVVPVRATGAAGTATDP